MTHGRLYAVDVLWGEDDKRDHFTLAPQYRDDTYTFKLRHRYTTPGKYGLRVRVFGSAHGCKRSATWRPTLTALPG